MDTESSHSNQSSYLTGTKNILEANAGTCMQSISFIKQTLSEKKILKICPFWGPSNQSK